ncbi:MAG: ABC transporter ATP-binding protein [Emergencia sp.]
MFKIGKKTAAAMAVIIAGVVASSLLPPQVLRIIMDDYLLAGKGDGLLLMGAAYLGAYALSSLFDVLKGLVLTSAGQDMVCSVRSAMEKKMSRLPAEYFTKNSSGSISSRFINDVDNISALFTDGIVSLLIDCFKIVGIVASIWMFSTGLGIFTLCLVPALGLLTNLFRRRMLASQKDNLKELGRVNNHIGESIRNILMIKTFHREEYMEQRYDQYLSRNYRTMSRVNFYDACYSPVIQVIMALSVSFVLYTAAGDSGSVLGITIGQTAASVSLLGNLFAPIDSLGTELAAIQKGLSGMESVREFMAEEEEEEKEIFPELYTAEPGFVFENVSFAYEKDRWILHDFSEKILPEENVAVVGRTGAGKSTLFRLAAGLIRPDSGRVLYGGVDVWKIAPEQKRRLIGYVEQKFSFVSGDVRQQISLGDESISEEEIRRAMDFVGLTGYVEGLEQGFDTQVREEMFSQGQRQLLAIARALVCEPKVLMLDEVTANLDTVTEERISDVLKRAGEGRIILSIAHRPSTIANAERIIRL